MKSSDTSYSMDYFLIFNPVRIENYYWTSRFVKFCLNKSTHDSLPYTVHILCLIEFIFLEQQTLPATLQMNYFNQGIYEGISCINLTGYFLDR